MAVAAAGAAMNSLAFFGFGRRPLTRATRSWVKYSSTRLPELVTVPFTNALENVGIPFLRGTKALTEYVEMPTCFTNGNPAKSFAMLGASTVNVRSEGFVLARNVL